MWFSRYNIKEKLLETVPFLWLKPTNYVGAMLKTLYVNLTHILKKKHLLFDVVPVVLWTSLSSLQTRSVE